MKRILRSLFLCAVAASPAIAQPGSTFLGAAHTFAVQGGSSVSSTGLTTITGDVGVAPGTSITGFPPGVIVGITHAADASAQQARDDMTTAYNNLVAMTVTNELTGQNLGGLTLGPGIHHFAASAPMSFLPLRLDAQGNPDAVFVIQIATNLDASDNSSVVMINGGAGCNVYWVVGSSATIGAGSHFQGTVIAQSDITLGEAATVSNGRLLSINGAVTLDSNVITSATCTAAAVRRVPHASADSEGRITITFVNPAGHPVMLQRTTAGDWTKEALDQTASPVPTTANRFATHTFVSSANGRSYVSVASSDGLFVIDSSTSPLSVRNLTTELQPEFSDATPITGPSTVFSSETGNVNIVGVNGAGELVRYFQTGTVNNGQPVWNFLNITTHELMPNGIGTPNFASNLVSYVSSWGGLNVAGLNSAGEVMTVWWAPGTPHWWANNLTTDSESPPFMVEAGLTAYSTPWGGLNLAGLDQAGHIIVQWWSPELGPGNWQASDLTELFGGPALNNQGLTSFVMPWGALNVAGVTPAGDLVNYWWVPGFEQWVVTSITDATAEANPGRITGAVTGVTNSNGVTSIIGESANGDMIRYFWQPGNGGTWHAEDVTAIATQRP